MKKVKLEKAGPVFVVTGICLLALFLLPIIVLTIIQNSFSDFYDQNETLLSIVLIGLAVFFALFSICFSVKMAVAERYARRIKSLMSDKQYYISLRRQRNAADYISVLEEDLKNDKYKIEKNLQIAEKLSADEFVRRGFGGIEILYVMGFDSLSKIEYEGNINDFFEWRSNLSGWKYSARNRLFLVCMIADRFDEELLESMKDSYSLSQYEAVLPVLVAPHTSRVYFLGGKAEKFSAEERAQKLVIKYLLGYKTGKISKRDLDKLPPYHFNREDYPETVGDVLALEKQSKKEQKQLKEDIRTKPDGVWFDSKEEGTILFYKENGRTMAVEYEKDIQSDTMIFREGRSFYFPKFTPANEEEAANMKDTVGKWLKAQNIKYRFE